MGSKKRARTARAATVADIGRIDAVNKAMGPIIVNFEHGQIREKAFANASPTVSSSFVRASKDSSKLPRRRRLQVDLSLEIDEVKYTNEADSNARMFETYIAVVDTSTKQIKLVQATETTCKACITAPPSTNPFIIKEEEENESERRAELKRQLVTQFGQEKGRRLYEQNDRMRVKTDEMKEKLDEIVDNAEDEKLDTEDWTKLHQLPRPPRNENAVSVEEVYTLDSMVEARVKTGLESAVTTLIDSYSSKEELNEDTETIKKFSKLFLEVLETTLVNRRGLNTEKLACALLMEGLIHLITLKCKEVRAKFLPDFLPKDIKHFVVDNFTVKGLVSKIERDRAISYILALGLNAFNFQLPTDLVLASIPNLDLDKLKIYSSLVGSTWLQDKNMGKIWMELKLPLLKYEPVRRSRKRKMR